VEANKYAAGSWKRAHAPQGLLKWVERYHAWMRGRPADRVKSPESARRASERGA
jgi:hypothetical protein